MLVRNIYLSVYVFGGEAETQDAEVNDFKHSTVFISSKTQFIFVILLLQLFIQILSSV
jgi:hypothetical protein